MIYGDGDVLGVAVRAYDAVSRGEGGFSVGYVPRLGVLRARVKDVFRVRYKVGVVSTSVRY